MPKKNTIAKKIEKSKSSKPTTLTLQLAVPADMVVPSANNALDAAARTFTYYERAEERGRFDSITGAMEEGEPLARDVQDALDTAAPGWRVDTADLFDTYKERRVLVVRAGNRVALDDVGWIEYVFPIERMPDNESDESDEE